MLCVRDKSCKYDVSKKIFKSLFTRVRKAHSTHGAGEVMLMIKPLPGLHGVVGDVLIADSAQWARLAPDITQGSDSSEFSVGDWTVRIRRYFTQCM